MARPLGYLTAGTTIVLVCDIQEKLKNVIDHFVETLTVAAKMIEGAKIMEIPMLVSEHYPKGLGSTVSELDIHHAHGGVIVKTKCSMICPKVHAMLGNELKHVNACILFGYETHTSIEQTAMDLLSLGKEVHIVADATSSRTKQDRILALNRLSQIGCFVTTSEAVLSKLTGDKNHPKFNEIRKIVKNPSPDSDIVSHVIPSLRIN